jgi:hypothetical protein
LKRKDQQEERGCGKEGPALVREMRHVDAFGAAG